MPRDGRGSGRFFGREAGAACANGPSVMRSSSLVLPFWNMRALHRTAMLLRRRRFARSYRGVGWEECRPSSRTCFLLNIHSSYVLFVCGK